jgi:hypothetical protein
MLEMELEYGVLSSAGEFKENKNINVSIEANA